MNDSAKQFAIIEKIKSLVKRGHGKSVAEKIQRSAYGRTRNKRDKEAHTPTYLAIAEQLQADDYQVFCAAGYHLARIAVNSENYREPVLEILQKAYKDNGRHKERKAYIGQKISEIQQTSFFQP